MYEEDRSENVQPAIEAPPPVEAGRMEAVFHKHHGLVFGAAYRITGNAADAEDVLQTVFLRLVRRAGATGEVIEMESYLYRAAVNAALDLMRLRRRNRDTSLEDAAPEARADASRAPDRAYDSGEIRNWLREAVARLGPTAAEMIVLRFFEDKKNQEIAQILGTTPGTVAVTLHRARTRLEREYRAYWGGAS